MLHATTPPTTAATSGLQFYRPIAKWFHWFLAALILCVWPLGFLIHLVADANKDVFYLLHESFGFLILWVMLANIAVRLLVGAPPKPPMPAAQKRLAQTVQILLYAALIAMPVAGFLATNAHGFPLQWFGAVEIVSPIGKSPGIAPTLSKIHEILGWTILGLVGLHVAGAVYHQAVMRDHTIERML